MSHSVLISRIILPNASSMSPLGCRMDILERTHGKLSSCLSPETFSSHSFPHLSWWQHHHSSCFSHSRLLSLPSPFDLSRSPVGYTFRICPESDLFPLLPWLPPWCNDSIALAPTHSEQKLVITVAPRDLFPSHLFPDYSLLFLQHTRHTPLLMASSLAGPLA